MLLVLINNGLLIILFAYEFDHLVFVGGGQRKSISMFGRIMQKQSFVSFATHQQTFQETKPAFTIMFAVALALSDASIISQTRASISIPLSTI